MAPIPVNLQEPILLAQSPCTNSPSTLSPSSFSFFPLFPSFSRWPLHLPPPHFSSDQRTNEEDVPANWGSNFPQLGSGLREQERADPPRSAAHGGGGGGAVMG